MSDVGINSYSQWSDLPNELLDMILMILSKMSLISILNFRAVCPSWRTAAKSFFLSSSYPQVHQVPWLMLPPEQEDDNDFHFFSLEDKKVIKRLNRPEDMNIPQKFHNGLCLGSSHGWLVVLDENVDPYLLDPFYLTQIQLPDIDTVEIFKFLKSADNGYDVVLCHGSSGSILHIESVHDLRGYFFANAVISANPHHSDGQFYVLMIASFDKLGSLLMFFRAGGQEVWMLLGEFDDTYCDIVCYDDRFYALNYPDKVEVWDTKIYTPEKDSVIVATWPGKIMETRYSLTNFCSHRAYLVESCNDLLLVLRYFGESVDEDGFAIHGEDTYKTLLFQVYKLDFSTNQWVEVESLGDRVLFLGGIQSMSLSARDRLACQPNSIYFSDDYWARIREHTIRYDLGVFNMEDKSIKSFYQCDLGTEPPPFWVDPEVLLYGCF